MTGRRESDGKPAREFDGFFGGIAGKGRSVFDDFRRIGKIVERQKLERVAEDGPDFPDLVPVSRRDEHGLHAPRLTEIFPLASLTHHFSAAELDDETTI
jgi:hypothetical protein